MHSIDDIAQTAGIPAEYVEPCGHGVAKIRLGALEELTDHPPGHLVVVTGITPTPLGEGKTTTAIGLAQGLARIGHRAAVALRQASMGPTFGIKGGAAGAGLSQVVPAERLNLHLTGDFHAVTAAHNLLAAMTDSHLYHGNSLGLEPHSVSWPRVLDVNDRALRSIVVGLGGRLDGVPRQTGFDITAASEVMVIVSLATSYADLRERLGRIVVGRALDGGPVTAEEIGAAGAMAAILRDALSPNLLQTTEGVPALVHTGPFGNIATGNSSVVADQIGVRIADYLVTEAGFGSDLGLERFVNLKCRVSGVHPATAVVVATARALKAHSGRFSISPGRPLPDELLVENPDAVHAGAANLHKHIDIVRGFGLSPIVAINAFPDDHPSEHAAMQEIATAAGVPSAVTSHVADGGAGAVALAETLVQTTVETRGTVGTQDTQDPQDTQDTQDTENTEDTRGQAPTTNARLRHTYELRAPLADKIAAVATGVYGADGVELSATARADLERFTRLGYGELPVVVAKTHLSISADPARPGAPSGWVLPVREVRLAAGAGYVYALTGALQTMPGLGRTPAALGIDLTADGTITGLR